MVMIILLLVLYFILHDLKKTVQHIVAYPTLSGAKLEELYEEFRVPA
ncbi:hypothetical protein [uncultured Ilyobacter sp.]|nr:hypothetical protein [uncultured Ilyobacter sp.]